MQTLYNRLYDEILLHAFHTKRHMKHSKKLMTVCAELTNPDPSLETDLKDLVTIGQRWSLTLSPKLSDAVPVRSTVTSSIKHWEIFIPHPLHSHSRCGEWTWLDLSVLQRPKDIGFILAIMDYFSKWVKVVPLKEVKALNVIKFIKHHVLYHFGVPRRIVHDNGVGLKAICPTFDDNKTYEVMFSNNFI